MDSTTPSTKSAGRDIPDLAAVSDYHSADSTVAQYATLTGPDLAQQVRGMKMGDVLTLLDMIRNVRQDQHKRIEAGAQLERELRHLVRDLVADPDAPVAAHPGLLAG